MISIRICVFCVQYLNTQDLIEYRRQLVAEHERKLVAIDVLLGKGVPCVPVRSGKRHKGCLPSAIIEAGVRFPKPFTANDIFGEVCALRPGETLRLWDIQHAIWRMTKSGDLVTVNGNERPKRYQLGKQFAPVVLNEPGLKATGLS